MKFFEDIVCQENKTGHIVCGDTYLCQRTAEQTIFVLCDGIGSGVYANIAAITCASRIMELLNTGIPLGSVSEMVADSMHRARKEGIPFSAFSVALILSDGQFTIYTYESPQPLLISNGCATILKSRYYTAGYEVVGEVTGSLNIGDSLILSSDGVTQAGLGHGFAFGIGENGITDWINTFTVNENRLRKLPSYIVSKCSEISGSRHEDDTTLAMIHCRQAKQVTILTGPPSKKSIDKDFAESFIAAQGFKVICGSTTTDIVSRELGIPVETVKLGTSFGSPPEYKIQGVDIATEGAVMLNQVYNILGEPIENLAPDSVVERLCYKITEADVVYFMVGNAVNNAHEMLYFKQVGIRQRRSTVQLITQKLRDMGKLVIEKYF